MNIKKKDEQSIKSNIKSGNIIEIDNNKYYLIINVPGNNRLMLYNLNSCSTVYCEYTQQEIYTHYNITAIYTNSDLILK